MGVCYNGAMKNYESLNDGGGQSNWDMSDVPFAGEKGQEERERMSNALSGVSSLLASTSLVFGGDDGNSGLVMGINSGESNEKVLGRINDMGNGRFQINYGEDAQGRGFNGFEQAADALDYFDKQYGEVITDSKTENFIKTCIAMWPMGNAGSAGVHEFAKAARIDEGTASLVNMVIDRNSMKLVNERFDKGSESAGERLLDVNKKYIAKLKDKQDAFRDDDTLEREARSICNVQKIVMDCEKEGAKIAKYGGKR